MNTPNKIELPLGFGMALAQNEPAMKRFELLSEREKAEVVQRVHGIKSKREMREFVANLVSGENAEV